MGMGTWVWQEILTVPQYQYLYFVLGIEMDQPWMWARHMVGTIPHPFSQLEKQSQRIFTS